MCADRLKESPKVCALTLAASSDHDFGDERMVHTGKCTAPKTGRKAPQPGREGALLLRAQGNQNANLLVLLSGG